MTTPPPRSPTRTARSALARTRRSAASSSPSASTAPSSAPSVAWCTRCWTPDGPRPAGPDVVRRVARRAGRRPPAAGGRRHRRRVGVALGAHAGRAPRLGRGGAAVSERWRGAPPRTTSSPCATSSGSRAGDGLAHVFGDLPYPDDDVLARWVLLLDDPSGRRRGGRGRRRVSSRSPPTTGRTCATWPCVPTTGAPDSVVRGSTAPRPPERGGCGCWPPTRAPAALYESLGLDAERRQPGVPLAAVPDRARVRRSLGSTHACLHADPLLEIADDLYALPLADFTPARDALAKEHKADKALAAGIKGLRKASLAAWVLNLLVRRDPDQVDQVLAVGAALRDAQENLDATQLREFTKQRRQLTASVTTAARRHGARGGREDHRVGRRPDRGDPHRRDARARRGEGRPERAARDVAVGDRARRPRPQRRGGAARGARLQRDRPAGRGARPDAAAPAPRRTRSRRRREGPQGRRRAAGRRPGRARRGREGAAGRATRRGEAPREDAAAPGRDRRAPQPDRRARRRGRGGRRRARRGRGGAGRGRGGRRRGEGGGRGGARGARLKG